MLPVIVARSSSSELTTMYFGFVDDMFLRHCANGAESTLCSVEFARWRHRERSLMFTLGHEQSDGHNILFRVRSF